MIDAATRLEGVENLIVQKLYFIIHAARQSGKTTYLMDMTKRLNAAGKYYTVYCSLEGLQNISDAESGIPLIVECLKQSFVICNIPKNESFAENANFSNYTGVLSNELFKYCRILDKPFFKAFDYKWYSLFSIAYILQCFKRTVNGIIFSFGI